MTGYLLSILGIVIAGVFIDIIVPTGTINKYIKGVYSIFVVAVLISPVIKILNKTNDLKITYEDYKINTNLLDYIHSQQVKLLEINIEKALEKEGFSKVDIILTFSIENDDLSYRSCQINLKNLVISKDKQHINKYEFIREIIKEHTMLGDEEIIFDVR